MNYFIKLNDTQTMKIDTTQIASITEKENGFDVVMISGMRVANIPSDIASELMELIK